MHTIIKQKSKIIFYLALIFVLALLSQTVTADSGQNAPMTAVMEAYLQGRVPATNPSAILVPEPCPTGGGMTASGYPCDNVDLIALMPHSMLGGTGVFANDIWGWTDSASGREFVMIGRGNGTVFVEITTPTTPVYLGYLPSQITVNSPWRDIKVYKNHAYIVSEADGHGIQVFDLTQLLSTTAPPVTFTNSAHYDGVSDCHNIVINEDSGFAYGVGCGAGSQSGCSWGLHAVDISTPLAPVFAGCFSADGYTHDAQCVTYNGPDLTHIGKEICVNSNEDTVTIADMSNPASPVQLSRSPYPGHGYTHQNWFTEDMTYVFVSDETDEFNFGHNTRTYIWDMTDLDAPALIGNFTSSLPAVDHNHYVKGHTLYQSNYTAGLRILDVSSAGTGILSEIGYFDVYPADDNAAYGGTWSNYPYFQSDIIAVSHSQVGLFLLKAKNSAAPADFVIEPVQPLGNNVVLQGCNENALFTLDAVNGFNSNVSLSVSGVPAGANGAFSPAIVMPDGSSTLSLNAPAGVAGTYLITITATGGGVTHTEYVRWEVPNNCVPTAVSLSSSGPIAAQPATWVILLFAAMSIMTALYLQTRIARVEK